MTSLQPLADYRLGAVWGALAPYSTTASVNRP
jgi:hypothetical protein